MTRFVRLGTLTAMLLAGAMVNAQEPSTKPFDENWAPLKMVGATGSPGNPVVLY